MPPTFYFICLLREVNQKYQEDVIVPTQPITEFSETMKIFVEWQQYNSLFCNAILLRDVLPGKCLRSTS